MMHTLYRLMLATAAIALFASPLHAKTAPCLQERLGYPAGARILIIHADDFGMAHSVNRAIEQALENGWVTSASVMVPCPWFPEVVRWAHAHPQADLGLHLVLDSEWTGYRWGPVAPVDKVQSLLDKEGYFYDDPSLFAHVKLQDVRTELDAQIDRARAMGLQVSHLDSHMIALSSTRHLFGVYQDTGRAYDLPIALVKNGSYRMPAGVVPPPNALALDRVITMDPGVPPNRWFDWYKRNLSSLKPGIYQLIVHLAYDDQEFRGATFDHPDWGAAWRQRDFDMVRSAQFRQFLREQKFILTNWGELSKRYRTRVQPHY
jgi:hypothetical protein